MGRAFKLIPTCGCYRRVRRERLLGVISGNRLIHPGLAGFPTPDATPCEVAKENGPPNTPRWRPNSARPMRESNTGSGEARRPRVLKTVAPQSEFRSSAH